MSISAYPSRVTLPRSPEGNWPRIIDYLCHRFSRISRTVWTERILKGAVLDGTDAPILLESPYVPGERIVYFRESTHEPVIPFQETIVFRNEHLLVACKPHFLPVIPSGNHVNETLLLRLKCKLDNPDLVPIHRIDRETAGLVMFSLDRKTRGAFQRMFMENCVKKTYEAITLWPSDWPMEPFRIENRIVRGDPWFTTRIVPGETNAVTDVEPIAVKDGRALLRLRPITGKKHQLRLQLGSIGCPIVHDRYYPVLMTKQDPNFDAPLQLLAKQIEFIDPVTREHRVFVSDRQLLVDRMGLDCHPVQPVARHTGLDGSDSH